MRKKNKVWKPQILGHLHLLALKDGNANSRRDTMDDKKNADTYIEIILLLDDKSLLLIIRNTPND